MVLQVLCSAFPLLIMSHISLYSSFFANEKLLTHKQKVGQFGSNISMFSFLKTPHPVGYCLVI